VLTDPYSSDAVDVALSPSNMLYVAFSGYVMRFKPGSSKGAILPLQAGTIDGFALDASGNIVVADRSSDDIKVFGEKSKNPQREFGSGLGGPGFMAFDATEKHLYVIENQEFSSDALIAIFDYASGKLISSTTASLSSFGIALSAPPPG